jgi:hypothetical protein
MPDLANLWYDAIQQKPLSDEEIKFVKQNLKARKVDQVVMAESILFLRAKNQTGIKQRLLTMCGQQKYRDNSMAMTILLFVLGFFLNSEIIKNKGALDLVRRGSQSPFTPARINAIRVLQRLAKSNNTEAIQLLKSSLKDKQSQVREAARVALKLAGVK